MTDPIPFNIIPNQIYIYVRVSTKSQAFGPAGLEDQKLICYNYVNKYYKYVPVEFFSEIGSSYNNKSKLPILSKIMKKITLGSLIIIRDISRLGRDTFQVFSLLKKIKKNNSHIIGINENLCYNYSRLMDREFSHSIIDSEKSSDRKHIKSTLRIRDIKSKGGWIGAPPYGTMIVKYNSIPNLYKNPNEIETISLVGSEFIKYRNLSVVSETLNNNKIPNRGGKLWTPSSIRYLLNKHYPSLFEVNKKKNINIKYLTNIIKNTELLSSVPNLPYETNETKQNNILSSEIDRINFNSDKNKI